MTTLPLSLISKMRNPGRAGVRHKFTSSAEATASIRARVDIDEAGRGVPLK